VALVAIEVLDGVGAGLISVAAPAAVADLTYGGGRTQTAMGTMTTVQALASAMSAAAAGYVVVHAGWTAAYGMLAVAPVFAIVALMTITMRDEKHKPSPHGEAKAAAISARV
jgi:MFS family permease